MLNALIICIIYIVGKTGCYTRGSKMGFWCENWRVSRGENPRIGLLSWCNSLGEL